MNTCVIEQSIRKMPNEPDLENFDFDPLIAHLMRGYSVNFNNGESVTFEQVATIAAKRMCDPYEYIQDNKVNVVEHFTNLLDEVAYDLLSAKADGKQPVYWRSI